MLTQADIAQLAPDPLRPISDEVERAYLGKVLLRRGRDRHWTPRGYFALEPAR